MDVSSLDSRRDGSDAVPAAFSPQPTARQAEIVRLYRAGWQPSEIARRFDLAISTVYQHARDARRRGADCPRATAGVAPPRRVEYFDYLKLHRAGWRGAAIARHFQVSPSTVCRALRILRESGARMEATA